jgi:hypothetical protein
VQRTIEVADFEFPRGPVTIQELMAMPRSDWSHLRTEINRRYQKDPLRPLARCRLCQGAVYIRSHYAGNEHLPVYAHYSGRQSNCPWHVGTTLTPDDARSAQYQGHQESALHRWMCNTIAGFIERDPRAKFVTVDSYRRPSIEMRGRFPDVYAELEGLGSFAVEVQLSKPFAPEIAARHLHYEAEGVALLWIFRDLPANLPQGFQDVITIQRGNAFLFDEAALNASVAQNKLKLSALLEADLGGFLKPRLVGLDDLDRSSGRSVFVTDRRSDKLIGFCRTGRELWWEAFRKTSASNSEFSFSSPCFERAWSSVRRYVPSLVAWKRLYWSKYAVPGDLHFSELAAILFSIARTAASNEERVYLTRYRGKGSLAAMLNAKLSSEQFKPYAMLIEAMLRGTKARDKLATVSVSRTLERAKLDAEQIIPSHPIWLAAARLFPEVLDGLRRAELEELGKLPDWANSR